jgi:large subunit ribosomal protein LP0
MADVIRKRAPKKEKVYSKMHTFLGKFTSILICDITNIPTNNIHKMRKQLRALDSEVLCGKVSVMYAAISNYIRDTKKFPAHLNKELLENFAEVILRHQVALIFTNKDIGDCVKITEQYQLKKQSKNGQISPIEVTLPAGPTGMDASQVDFFQNLRIQTKVVRNQLEVINATKILSVGQKITLSEINLMVKFNIKPFHHKIEIFNVILGGKMYDQGILAINNETMEKALLRGISNIAGFGLATRISNKASAPHVIANSFRNIMALSVGTNVEMRQCSGLKSSAPVVVEVKKEEKKVVKKEAPKKVEKEESSDDGYPMGF